MTCAGWGGGVGTGTGVGKNLAHLFPCQPGLHLHCPVVTPVVMLSDTMHSPWPAQVPNGGVTGHRGVGEGAGAFCANTEQWLISV